MSVLVQVRCHCFGRAGEDVRLVRRHCLPGRSSADRAFTANSRPDKQWHDSRSIRGAGWPDRSLRGLGRGATGRFTLGVPVS